MNTYARILAAVGLIFGAAGCVTEYGPIHIENVHAFDPDDCGAVPDEEDDILAGGSLDTALGTGYISWVHISSSTGDVVEPGSTPATTVERTDANDIVITEVRVSYRSNPDLGLPAVTYPVHAVISAGGDLFGVFNFFPAEAGEALQGAVVPGDRVVVNVSMEFAGHLRSGGFVKSGQMIFPITVVNSGFTCPTGTTPQFAGCGLPGQDQSIVTCM